MRRVSTTEALKPSEFAVIACAVRTGHPVDGFGNRTPSGKRPILCFSDRDTAEHFARSKVRADPNVECWLLDHTGTQLAVLRNQHERAHRGDHRPWWRRFRRGTKDGFCCAPARGLFLSRLEYGAFLVAGKVRPDAPLAFLAGSVLAHNRERTTLLEVLRSAELTLEGHGLTNVKLYEYGHVHFCTHCGTHLRKFYGPDAGALRDDTFAQDLASPRWRLV
jgi:hypothetical protein